jgi:hypothetical protein
MNDPYRLCDPENGNADCIDASFCDTTFEPDDRCKHTWEGSLGDRARPVEPDSTLIDDGVVRSAICTTSTVAEDCIPSAVKLCQPPVLKVEANVDTEDFPLFNAGLITGAWDLTWDPDQQHNLISSTSGDVDYLGSGTNSLKDTIRLCLDHYWKLSNPPASEWTGTTEGCFWDEEPLPSP